MNQLSEEKLILINTFKVTTADTDMEARLRLGSLTNYLIQSAINSADNLGFGLSGLIEKQLTWVLNRLTLEIYQPFKWYDEVEVETWPKDVERILYFRDFIVRNQQQQVAARATSAWTAIDLATKRPKQVDGAQSELFRYLRNRHSLQTPPQRLNAIDSGEPFEYTAHYFDIDLNRHVTTTRYIDWMMDTFDSTFHANHVPTKMSVNFLKETMPGDTLQFKRIQITDNQYAFEGTNMGSSTKAFRGLIVF